MALSSKHWTIFPILSYFLVDLIIYKVAVAKESQYLLDTSYIHIWFESNLVNFEFPEGLNTVLGSSQPPYLKIGVEFALTKNVPFSKISVKI